jgi:redox-sensitive bicupin YhaK (pirin superfamily)
VIQIRREREIHHEDGGWFQARWHFSFDRYRDPEQMGVGPLRVFNHDRLAAGAVWPMHPHADVEGITYVWKGTFRHADNLGNDGILHPGAVQLMTLGSGALHSEQNGSKTEPMEFLQLCILPDVADLQPGLQQHQFSKDDRTGRLLKAIGPDEKDVVKVHQDATVYLAALDPGQQVSHTFAAGRGGYLYLIDGSLNLNQDQLSSGDAAKILDPVEVRLGADATSELLLVDVPLHYSPVGVWAR